MTPLWLPIVVTCSHDCKTNIDSCGEFYLVSVFNEDLFCKITGFMNGVWLAVAPVVLVGDAGALVRPLLAVTFRYKTFRGI